MASNKRTIYLGLDYSQFTGGVTEVNRKMSLLDAEFKLATQQAKNYGNETDALGVKEDYLTQKIALQTQKVDAAKKAYDEAMGSNKASQKEIDELDKKLLNERLKLEQLNASLEQTKKETDAASDKNRAYAEGISDINQKMGILDLQYELTAQEARNYGKQTDLLSAQQEYLSQKIELQSQKVDEMQRAYNDAINTQGKSEAEMQALGQEILQEKIKLEKLNGELAENKKATDNATGANKSFGDEIRDVASSLGLNISPALEKLAKKFDGVSAAVGNAVLAMGAMVAGLLNCTKAAADNADELLTLADKTGMTTDELQKLQYASKFVDVEFSTLVTDIGRFEQSMFKARDGSKDVADAFKKLHVRITDSRGALKDQNTVFWQAIDALGKVKNETERDALANELFGKSYKDLIPLIKAGSEEINRLNQEYEELGLGMSEENLQKLNTLKDEWTRLDEVWTNVKNNLGLALLPVLTALFDAISRIPEPVLRTMVVLAGIVASIVLVVKAIKSVTDTGKAITSFFKSFDASSMKTTAIIIGVVVALIALAAIIAVIIGKSDELNSSMKSIGNMAQNVQNDVSGAQSNYQRTQANYTQRNASGTEYFQGGKTWVGEEGPEIVELPKGTRITSANESARMVGYDNTSKASAQLTGNRVNNYYITIDAKNVTDFNRVVEMANQMQMATRRI